MFINDYKVNENSIHAIKNQLDQLTRGIPDYVAIQAGNAVAQAIGQRVKFQSEDARGQRLDPTEPSTSKDKAERGIPDRPLVDTGALTDPSAWSVTYDGNKITLNLDGDLHEKWDNLILIAQETGRNWNYAFDLNEAELGAALFALIRWVNEKLGIDTFETDLEISPELESAYAK